jgi:hypothetical protein
MDLLVSILAYLGTVTTIVVAVVMSYDAFIYTPLHSINPQHTLTVAAKPSPAKAASSASAGKIAPPHVAAASLPRSASSRSALAAKAAPQSNFAAERRAASARKEAVRQQYMRRLARQGRGREWASQQPPGGFGLGYTEQPPAGLYNAFPYQ